MLKLIHKIIEMISKLKNLFVKADNIGQGVKEILPEPPKDSA